MKSLSVILLFYCLLRCLQRLPHAAGARSLLRLKLHAPDLFPESFDWDPEHGRFLIGSISQGTVWELGSDGVMEEFLQDPDCAGRAGIAGVKVDSRLNRVIVAMTDAPNYSYGGVAAYNLDTKERVFFARLDNIGVAEGEKSCPNDIAVNVKTGDIYVTNSFGNFLWNVTKDGIPSVFVKHEIFTSQPLIEEGSEHVGFNGIVFTGKYVLAVQTNSGALFRVGVEDWSVRKVITKVQFPQADGMVLREDGILVVVSTEKIWLVQSTSRWAAAKVVDTLQLNPLDVTTAVAVRKKATFVLHSHLMDMMKGQSREKFEIEEVEFPSDSAESDPLWLIALIVLVLVAMTSWRFKMGHIYEQHKRKKTA